MNRPTAMLLLVLTAAALVYSIYASFQGDFVRALAIYPLLIVAWVFLRRGGKGGR